MSGDKNKFAKLFQNAMAMFFAIEKTVKRSERDMK
jgi:hypothetical protein